MFDDPPLPLPPPGAVTLVLNDYWGPSTTNLEHKDYWAPFTAQIQRELGLPLVEYGSTRRFHGGMDRKIEVIFHCSPTDLAALKAKIEATPTITLPLSATLQTVFVATWEWPGSSVPAPVVCYKCQKQGHYAASCLPCSGCKAQMASADTLKKHEALCPQVSRPAPTRQNREGKSPNKRLRGGPTTAPKAKAVVDSEGYTSIPVKEKGAPLNPLKRTKPMRDDRRSRSSSSTTSTITDPFVEAFSQPSSSSMDVDPSATAPAVSPDKDGDVSVRSSE